ncbi:restriction endonuclease subunit S [Leeuwenhoekiella aequorea]|uniref:Type I restriction enzyme S subunit n=2 Tax=Flavobacteriia TaxID=117743 RepID=A0A4Q0PD35_9FLAO|nr:restriction endonuclease subunit S [Leeuwenhoekiella aequorea]AOE06019.1 type I restriction-modification system, specificity subunit S [uncultured bacterium]RXG24296.1 type I restriction enzyme S subunit [Leeuwenhoekiella aequorea]CCF99595.1 type I restriction-modification system, specificity subunit S [uncultured Flavobacteriia bacterium]
MQNIKPLTPKLRFPEFKDDWKEESFRNLTKINQGLQIPISERLTKEQNGSYFYITNEFLRANSEKKYYIKNPSKSVICSEEDILMTRTGNTGTVVTNVSGAFHNNFFKIAYSKKLIKSFLYYYLILTNTQNLILRLAGTSTIPDLNHSDFYRIKIQYPFLAEQQKIASFLTAVDTKINQLTKKKELLDQYKKGVMQKLFSQEIRFKDENGNDFPEWEEKRLSKITKYYDGTHQTPNYVSRGIPFYSVEHVTANQFEQTKYISKEVFDKENKRVKLEKGDILMTRIGNVGKAKYIDWDVKGSFYVSLALIKQGSSFSSKYLAQYINAEPFQRELWKRIIHVAFPIKINLGEIGNCLVKLPCIEEQTRIANFLSAIDDKIEAVNTQIDKTTTFKRGLLQHMFV